MINYPDSDTRYKRMKEKIQANTDITDFRAGSTARAIVDIINEEIEDIYSRMTRYFENSFLSTAKGKYIDLIADKRCIRMAGETDDNYRYRVSVTPLVEAKNNETALRLKCMEIDGVKDVIMVPYTYGTGSFSAFVITDNKNTPSSILSAVQEVLNNNKAFGIKGIATAPNIINVDVQFSVYMKTGCTEAEALAASTNIIDVTKNYIDNIEMGGMFSAAALLNKVSDASESIAHAEITDMIIDNKRTFSKFYQCKWNEKIFAGSIGIL